MKIKKINRSSVNGKNIKYKKKKIYKKTYSLRKQIL
jgi:hypothetical protein